VRSPVVQKDNQNNLKINIYAEPYWKRSMANQTLFAVYCNPIGFFMVPPLPPSLCLKIKKNFIFIVFSLEQMEG
jgi:hypothetical protein